MINAGLGFSEGTKGIEAAKEASLQALENAGIKRADWAVVFCTFPHRESYSEILKFVCELTQTTNVSGCSSIGVICNQTEIEGDHAVTVLVGSSDQMKFNCFLVGGTSDGGYSAGTDIGNSLAPLENQESLLVLLPDPFHIHPDLLFKGIQSKLGNIPIVGASASENPYVNETSQFCGDSVRQSAVSGFLMKGDFNYSIGITQGCQPIGGPSVITRCENNIIIELDDKPAYEVMKGHVPQTILENPHDLIRTLFVGFSPDPGASEIVGGDYLIRNIMGINPESGIIGVAENVRKGQRITFAIRNPQMAREDLKQMLEGIKSSTGPEKPSKFGLYFNCCARGSSLYGQNGIDTAYISNYLEGVPIIGFFGNSEFANLRGKNHLFTYTGVLVLISE